MKITIVKCALCGEEFENKGSYIKKYCTKKCRYKVHGEIMGAQMASLTAEEKKARYEKQLKTVKERYNRDTCVNPKKLSETYHAKPREYWDARNIKSKKTKFEKYGNENYHNTKKSKETKKMRYGDENYCNSEKNIKTKFERYGCYWTNSAKANKTKEEKYGSLSNIAKKAFSTYEKNYGKRHPSHRNIANYENYNLEYIEKHFVHNGEINLKGFCEYFNIKIGSNFLKEFDLPETVKKRSSRIEESFLDKLNIKNRQHSIFSYYVDGFENGIVYEFLGDFWHGKSQSEELHPILESTHKDLYLNTIKRLEKILEHPDVKEIYYIWESDYKSQGLKALKKFTKGCEL